MPWHVAQFETKSFFPSATSEAEKASAEASLGERTANKPPVAINAIKMMARSAIG